MFNEPQRKQLRLRGYDYQEDGVYFVTVCTHEREMLFGDVVGEEVSLNDFGKIAHQCWDSLPDHFLFVQLDAFVVMPNHIHLLIVINLYAVRTSNTKSNSLGSIIGSFKSAVSKRVNEERKTGGAPVWQRGYYDRVVRNERELNVIREYIFYNPAKWANDENNPLK